ncbi:hypothetical protein LZ31DRAFT_51020 [Colletotrichum somersetense]|nr:hypothetical protein LZ31DRAFT_51020 [Colletotrichum somersetense]
MYLALILGSILSPWLSARSVGAVPALKEDYYRTGLPGLVAALRSPFPRRGRNVRQPGQAARPIIFELSFLRLESLDRHLDAAPADLPVLPTNAPRLQVTGEVHARCTPLMENLSRQAHGGD